MKITRYHFDCPHCDSNTWVFKDQIKDNKANIKCQNCDEPIKIYKKDGCLKAEKDSTTLFKFW